VAGYYEYGNEYLGPKNGGGELIGSMDFKQTQYSVGYSPARTARNNSSHLLALSVPTAHPQISSWFG